MVLTQILKRYSSYISSGYKTKLKTYLLQFSASAVTAALGWAPAIPGWVPSELPSMDGTHSIRGLGNEQEQLCILLPTQVWFPNDLEVTSLTDDPQTYEVARIHTY